MGFWKFVGWFILVIIALLPVILCVYGLYQEKHPITLAEFQKPVLNESGTFSFLNPAIGYLNYGLAKFSGFAENIFSRVIGWRTVTGKLQCTNMLSYLWTGVFAAIWLFIGFALYFLPFTGWNLFDVIWVWTGGSYSNLTRGKTFVRWSRMSSRTTKDKWLFIISDKWWKSLLIIGIYTYIMSFIPILNRFFQIITLEIFQPNWFIQSLIIAFEIGFLPMMLQEYGNYRKRYKIYRKTLAEETYKKMAEAAING